MQPTVEHRQYFIYCETAPLGDGTFSTYGAIRKPHPSGTGLPFETSFRPQKRYINESKAYNGGVGFAKRLIDGFWAAVGQ